RRLEATGVAETAAADGRTARERWGAREREVKWGKSERERRGSLNRETEGRTWPGEAGIAGRRGGVGEAREAGFENRIPAISGAGASGRERGVGAGNAAHARAWSTWPGGGGGVDAAAVSGAAVAGAASAGGGGRTRQVGPTCRRPRERRAAGGLAGPRPAAGPAGRGGRKGKKMGRRPI
ncbi:Os09g0482821, partial [Oryza sativa Japonica Group]